MNQVGNSKFPPIGHLIFFFLPTYTMQNKTREIQKKLAKSAWSYLVNFPTLCFFF
jgi:hypothetical protein